MLILTNTGSQALAPGQSVVYNLVILHMGRGECYREGSGSVVLGQRNALYEIDFGANIGATTAASQAQLDIMLNGSPLVETTMISTTAAIGDLNNVSRHTTIRTCCCCPETITITNTGETTVTVEDPSLSVKPIVAR